MGHFALGRLLRYFIQPLLRDTLYITLYTLTHSDIIDLPLQPANSFWLNRTTMKKAKPTQSNTPAKTARKRTPARKQNFPLQLFFSFYTAKVR